MSSFFQTALVVLLGLLTSGCELTLDLLYRGEPEQPAFEIHFLELNGRMFQLKVVEEPQVEGGMLPYFRGKTNRNFNELIVSGAFRSIRDPQVFLDDQCSSPLDSSSYSLQMTPDQLRIKMNASVTEERVHVYYLGYGMFYRGSSLKESRTERVCSARSIEVELQRQPLLSKVAVDYFRQREYEHQPQVSVSNVELGAHLSYFARRNCEGALITELPVDRASLRLAPDYDSQFVKQKLAGIPFGAYEISVKKRDSFGNEICVNSDEPNTLTAWSPLKKVFKAAPDGYEVYLGLKENGTLAVWGREDQPGYPSVSELAALKQKLYSLGVNPQTGGPLIQVVDVVSAGESWSLVFSDGTVMCWGPAKEHFSTVAPIFNGVLPVKNLKANIGAFAALLDNGSVVTWGVPGYGVGEDPGSVLVHLNDLADPIVEIAASSMAFAARSNSGKVYTWGEPGSGGDSSGVATQIRGVHPVKQLFAGFGDFVALREDGSAVSWGSASTMDVPFNAVASQLSGEVKVKNVFFTDFAVAALREDGSVVTWGASSAGGDSTSVSTAVNGTVKVVSVKSTVEAFAALRENGSVVTWGAPNRGGDSLEVVNELNGSTPVVELASSRHSFSALRQDGSVISWKKTSYGGDNSAVSTQVDGSVPVKALFSTAEAFAALRVDGSVVAWGTPAWGGNPYGLQGLLKGEIPVREILSTSTAFFALREDGSVVPWGNASPNLDDNTVVGYAQNPMNAERDFDGSLPITQLLSNGGGFLGLRNDGSLASWGTTGSGGMIHAARTLLKESGRTIESLFVSQRSTWVDYMQGNGNNLDWMGSRLSDGSLLLWGSFFNLPVHLSSSLDVSQGVLKIDPGSSSIQKIVSNLMGGVAALRENGSVITWGIGSGGDSSAVAHLMDGSVPVKDIAKNHLSFAAIREDGSVVAWGSGPHGANTSSVSSQIDGTQPVEKIVGTHSAFAALRRDGSVVTWGDTYFGGNSTSVASLINDPGNPVEDLVSNARSIAALRRDGSLVAWGSDGGTEYQTIADQVNGQVPVVEVIPGGFSFSALRVNGSVVSWCGGMAGPMGSDYDASKLNGGVPVTEVVTNRNDEFAALRVDGSVVYWGCGEVGPNASFASIAPQVNGQVIRVKKIFANSYAFAALREDGSVVTWGPADKGGDLTSVGSSLNGTIPVIKIVPGVESFAALRSDGSVIFWGNKLIKSKFYQSGLNDL